MRGSIHLEAAPVRRSLFRKYFLALFAAVIVPMAASGISDAWFGYRDQRAMLSALLRVETTSAAGKIQSFLDGIKDQLGWTVQQTLDRGYQGDSIGSMHCGRCAKPRQSSASVLSTVPAWNGCTSPALT